MADQTPSAPLRSNSQDASKGAVAPVGPSRRWYQFTVRAVLALILFAGVGLTAWRVYIGPYRAQSETAQLIQRLGGTYRAEAFPTWMSGLAGFEMQDITLVNLADCDTPDEYVEQIVLLPRIQTLVVGGQAFNDEACKKLHALETLRWLVLDSTVVTEDAIGTLQTARPGLVIHRSDRRFISDSGPSTETTPSGEYAELQQLVGAEFFKQIDLACADDDARIAKLAAATTINRLAVCVTSNQVTAAGVAQIANIRGLKHFWFWTKTYDDTMVAALERLDKLNELSLGSTAGMDDGQLARLGRLRNLTSLFAGDAGVTDVGLARIARFAELRRLVLSRGSITDAGVAKLNKLRKLEELELRETAISGIGLAELPPSVVELDLSESTLTDAGLARLPALPNLKHLQLSGTLVTDVGLAHLAKLPALEWLELDDDRITDAGLSHLERLPKLDTLLIHGTDVTVAGLVPLARLKKLKCLLFDEEKIDPKAAAKALPQCRFQY